MLGRLLGAFVMMLIAAPSLGATFQSANFHDFNTGVDVAGAGTMIREDDGVEVRLALAGLDKKAAYSIWWIVFNNPEACLGGGIGTCGAADLGPNSLAHSAVINAAGFVTGTDGTVNLTAELEVGPTPDGIVNPFGNLENSEAAEIHLLVQSHGKVLVGSVDAQITIPGAACNGNTCGDQFAIAFLPVAAP